MQVLHSNWQYSQFQDILVQNQLVPFTENLVFSDLVTGFHFTPTNNASGTDSGIIQDTLGQTVTLKFVESVVVKESSSLVAGPPTDNVFGTDSGVMQDSLIQSITLNFTESIVGNDGVAQIPIGTGHSSVHTGWAWRSGLKPFHRSLVAPETTGSHVNFYYPGTDDNQTAYITMSAPGSSLFKPQGYQAFVSSGTSIVAFTESVIAQDSVKYTADKYFTESLVLNELACAFKGDLEKDSTVIQDSMKQIVTLKFTESLIAQDGLTITSTSTSTNMDDYWTVGINVGQVETGFWTTVEQVELAFQDDTYTINMPVLQNTLVAVTNATSLSNPFQPTLMVNGTVIYQNPANPAPTLATGATGTSVFFRYSNAGVTGLNLCDLYNFGFSLDYSGGNFSVTSKNPVGGSYYTVIPINSFDPNAPLLTPVIVDYGNNFPGMLGQQFFFPQYDAKYAGSYFGPSFVPNNLGQNLQFFGLNGSITSSGRIKSNSAYGFTAGGIFGNILMHRQFALLAYNFKEFAGLFMGNAPTIVPPTPQNQLTCSVAAQAIINTVNQYSIQQGLGEISLVWAVQDAPYFDTVAQAGDTAIQAISSLAAHCGGTLRWDGNNTYVVAYPDVAYGEFTVPDCHLIAAGGIEEEYLLDLETGRTGSGVVAIPTWAQQDLSQKNLPSDAAAKGNTPTVNQIAKITKVLTSNDADLVYDLPQDFDTVYIQFLVPVGKSTGGKAPIANESWITTDPTQWFVFDTASLSGGAGQLTEFVFYTNIGGRLIPQVRVDSLCFPVGNDSIDNGHFVLSLACTRHDLSGAFTQSQNDLNDYKRALAAYNVKNYQFVKTYTGTINCMFFGSIPLPGMIGSATVDDLTVSGVIESVSFQYPGFLTIQVARYLRLDMLKPPFQWNGTTAGQGIAGGKPKGYGP